MYFGIPVIICCSGGNSALLLKAKSPKARERARLPLTLLNLTQPPAAWILLLSSALVGLWSKDRGTATPFLLATARESPKFA